MAEQSLGQENAAQPLPFEHEEQSFIQRLSSDELFTLAKSGFSQAIPHRFTEERLRNFIQTNVEGATVNGTNVIVVHQDYEEQQGRMDDVLHAYIGDPRTKVVLVEYFEPEIKENVARFPVAGKLLSEILSKEENSPRWAFAREVTTACQQEGKPIAVADIANKPFYYVDALIPFILAYAVPPIGIPATTEYLFNRLGEITKKGMFNKDKVHMWEKLIYDIEDTRRVNVAAGLRQLASEYKPSKKDQQERPETQPPQIVAAYTPTHAKRIMHYLTALSSAERLSRQAKQLLYRATMPNLDFSVREYQYKDTLARVSGDPNLAGWQRVSNRAINPLR